jgi:hypothetical protein
VDELVDRAWPGRLRVCCGSSRVVVRNTGNAPSIRVLSTLPNQDAMKELLVGPLMHDDRHR